tara:strand:- start:7574 stop:8077 length:504 start_codon:yes stop_codon:yes gene_type:complete
MSANVKVTLDLPMDLDGVLFESEMEVLEEMGEDSVILAKEHWQGWRYGPSYPEEQKGTSRSGWKFRMMRAGEFGYERGVEILNDAKARVGKEKGQMYAADIHRSGSRIREWTVVQDRIEDEILPDKITELKNRIIKNIGRKRKRVTLRAMEGTMAQNFDILSGTTTI